MILKKFFNIGSSKLESPRVLSLSGESVWFKGLFVINSLSTKAIFLTIPKAFVKSPNLELVVPKYRNNYES